MRVIKKRRLCRRFFFSETKSAVNFHRTFLTYLFHLHFQSH